VAPTPVLLAAVAFFFALLALAVIAIFDDGFRHAIAAHQLGRLPTGIIWFGAIGGSLASLTGIFRHDGRDWDHAWNFWHVMRPATGAVMGSLGAFFLLVSTEVAATGSARPDVRPDIYCAAAFMAGFAERPLRELVKRLTDALYGTRQCCQKSPCDDCKQDAIAVAGAPQGASGSPSRARSDRDSSLVGPLTHAARAAAARR
jgi:hypothetical protein